MYHKFSGVRVFYIIVINESHFEAKHVFVMFQIAKDATKRLEFLIN